MPVLFVQFNKMLCTTGEQALKWLNRDKERRCLENPLKCLCAFWGMFPRGISTHKYMGSSSICTTVTTPQISIYQKRIWHCAKVSKKRVKCSFSLPEGDTAVNGVWSLKGVAEPDVQRSLLLEGDSDHLPLTPEWGWAGSAESWEGLILSTRYRWSLDGPTQVGDCVSKHLKIGSIPL